jgi:hypothetical protein
MKKILWLSMVVLFTTACQSRLQKASESDLELDLIIVDTPSTESYTSTSEPYANVETIENGYYHADVEFANYEVGTSKTFDLIVGVENNHVINIQTPMEINISDPFEAPLLKNGKALIKIPNKKFYYITLQSKLPSDYQPKDFAETNQEKEYDEEGYLITYDKSVYDIVEPNYYYNSSWASSNFMDYIGTKDESYYLEKIEEEMKLLERGDKAKEDMRVVSELFSCLSGGHFISTADFNKAVSSINLSYKTKRLTDELSLVRIDLNENTYYLIANSNVSKGYNFKASSYSGSRLEMSSKRNVLCKSLAVLTHSPYKYTFTLDYANLVSLCMDDLKNP